MVQPSLRFDVFANDHQHPFIIVGTEKCTTAAATALLLSHAHLERPARVHCMTRPGMLLHLLLSPFSRSVALLVISHHTFVHLDWMGPAVRGMSIPKSMSNAIHFLLNNCTRQVTSRSTVVQFFPVSTRGCVVAPYELSGTWFHIVLQSCHVCSRFDSFTVTPLTAHL